MEQQIRTFGDPVLKSKASAVTDVDGKIARLVDDMFDSLYTTDTGCALAAPQRRPRSPPSCGGAPSRALRRGSRPATPTRRRWSATRRCASSAPPSAPPWLSAISY
jgi:hypothetical protein